jgi:hypothetical protein
LKGVSFIGIKFSMRKIATGLKNYLYEKAFQTFNQAFENDERD